MSDALLKAFNTAADAAHIAALTAYQAIGHAEQCAKALHDSTGGIGFSRACHTVEVAYRAVLDLVSETSDIGDNYNDTPRSRGVELPKAKPLLIYTWIPNRLIVSKPEDHIGTVDTCHPDSAALSFQSCWTIIKEVHASLGYFDTVVYECEYIETTREGMIEFKRLRIVETY